MFVTVKPDSAGSSVDRQSDLRRGITIAGKPTLRILRSSNSLSSNKPSRHKLAATATAIASRCLETQVFSYHRRTRCCGFYKGGFRTRSFSSASSSISSGQGATHLFPKSSLHQMEETSTKMRLHQIQKLLRWHT